jgi:hypothetical protein
VRVLRKNDLPETAGEVMKPPARVFVARLLGADGLVDDLVEFFQDFGDVGGIAPLLELLVNGFEVVVADGISEGRGRTGRGLPEDS